MKIILLYLATITIWHPALGQQSSSLSFFRLPVLADSTYLPGDAYVSCRYYALKKIPLKNYKGSDPAIAKLSLIIKHTGLNEKTAYLNLSDNSDTTVSNSFEFYNFFTSKSASPQLISKIETGIYTVFFVLLEEGFPLMTFCVLRQGNTFLNHTALLYHPAIAAIAAAVNHSYSFPAEAAPVSSIPAKNSKIGFGIPGDPENSIAFYFDLVPIHASCDSMITGTLPAERALYCHALASLKSGDFENYYKALSESGRQSVKESLEGLPQKDIEAYQRYKSSYSFLNNAIDLGPLKLLLVSDPRNDDPTAYRSIYLGKDGKGAIKWMNENHEFYLDDLLRTPEFRSVLSGPATGQQNN